MLSYVHAPQDSHAQTAFYTQRLLEHFAISRGEIVQLAEEVARDKQLSE